MSQNTWTAVDRYVEQTLVGTDAVLEQTLKATEAAKLPPISVSAPQGKLLYLLALTRGARSILEIGTLGGYSTIWMARALPPEGRLISLEIDPKHAAVARSNIELAGLSEKVDIRIGPALETLEKIQTEGKGPFDLVFIDADKARIPSYFQWSMKLTRRGSLIVVDNVVRNGRVINTDDADPDLQGIRKFNELVAQEPRVSATAIQTVGVKGYDGFALLLVTG
jgi:predicted O-methyltransferase YrrM